MKVRARIRGLSSLLFGCVVMACLWAPTALEAQCSPTPSDNFLVDGGGFTWDVKCNGSVNDGSTDAYDGMFTLKINGTPFPVSSNFNLELVQRQVVFGPEPVAGLNVTRRVFVPFDDHWARFLEYLENPTGSSIVVNVEITGNLGSDAGTTTTGSFDGDSIYTSADRWFTTDDALDGDGDPSLNFNLWGAGGAVAPSAASVSTEFPSTTFPVTVPANSTVILMHFGGQNTNRAASQAKAAFLDGLQGSVLYGISSADLAKIINWNTSGISGANLAVSLVGPGTNPRVGDRLLFTATVGNGCTDDATGVVAHYTVPAGSIFISASSSQGTCVGSATTADCDLGNIVCGSTARAFFSIAATAPGTISSSVSVSANEPDPQTVNNTASISTDVFVVLPNLYAVAGSSGDVTDFQILDPATGSTVARLFTNIAYVGLAFKPSNGMAYTLQSPRYYFNGNPGQVIWQITLGFGGSGTYISGGVGSYTDIAFDLFDNLYVWDKGANKLATLDANTGVATDLGISGLSGTSGNGLAASSANTFLIAPNGEDGSLYTVNRLTGVAGSPLALSGGSGTGRPISGLAFDKNGTLYGVCHDRHSGHSELMTIDTTTGAITFIGPTEAQFDSIAFDPTAMDLGVDVLDNPDPVQAGASLTYTIVVTNHSGSSAPNVSLIDNVPPSVTIGTINTTKGSCGQYGSVVQCFLGFMNVSDTVVVTITGTALGPAGTINNTAYVTADRSDSDAANNTATQDTTVTCPGAAISVSPSSLPGSSVGSAYNQTVSASGGTPPFTYSVSAGSLPAGLTLDANSGAISGPTNTAGTFSFTITASDSLGCAGSQAYSITVGPACLFCDDFEDGALANDWTYLKPSWTESGGNLIGTPTGKKAQAVAAPAFAGCSLCTVDAALETDGGALNKIFFYGWFVDKKNTLVVLMKQENNKFVMKQVVNGVTLHKTKGIPSGGINVGQFYDVKVNYDGTNFTLIVDGATLATMPSGATPNGTISFTAKNTTARFGYITVN